MSNETVWLTQVQLVELFQSSKSNISKHIFEEGNLAKKYPLFFRTGFCLKVRPRPYCRKRHTSSLMRTKNHAFAWFLKVRPTGIELVSSAPQADTLSIELWALKSDFVSRINYYLIILTFLFVVFNGFYKNLFLRRKSIYLLYHFSFRINTPNCYNNSMNEAKTGTYVYDKKLGKVVKVSDRVPSVKKSAGHVCGGCCGCCHGNND